MTRSSRELSIDMVIHRGIFKNYQIMLFPYAPYLKQELVFTAYQGL